LIYINRNETTSPVEIEPQLSTVAAPVVDTLVPGHRTVAPDIDTIADVERLGDDLGREHGAAAAALDQLVNRALDVRKMQRDDQFGTGPYTLPNVRPAINPAGIRQSQRGREPASSRRKGSGLKIY
jgi:hypothetical protein